MPYNLNGAKRDLGTFIGGFYRSPFPTLNSLSPLPTPFHPFSPPLMTTRRSQTWAIITPYGNGGTHLTVTSRLEMHYVCTEYINLYLRG